MEPYITIPVEEELESLKQYLSTQPADLHVSIDSTIPADRYVIPKSLTLIVQHAQRNNLYPLHITIIFLKHTIEISYRIHPRQIPDENFPDIDQLVTLYRHYFNLPSVRQENERITVVIPLFI